MKENKQNTTEILSDQNSFLCCYTEQQFTNRITNLQS